MKEKDCLVDWARCQLEPEKASAYLASVALKAFSGAHLSKHEKQIMGIAFEDMGSTSPLMVALTFLDSFYDHLEAQHPVVEEK